MTACSPITATRGNIADPDRIAEIKAGQTTRDDVAAILGTPTSVGTFDSDVWYYIGSKTEKVAFFKPEVVDRRVVVVHFDKSGVVQDIKRVDGDEGRDIDMVQRTTPTNGRELGFLEQLLGNVGRFSAKDANGKGPGR